MYCFCWLLDSNVFILSSEMQGPSTPPKHTNQAAHLFGKGAGIKSHIYQPLRNESFYPQVGWRKSMCKYLGPQQSLGTNDQHSGPHQKLLVQ